MKKLVLTSLSIVICLNGAAVSAATTSFRCKNDLVNVGDAKASALVKCGEPVVKDSFCKPAEAKVVVVPKNGTAVAASTPCETVDEWTYNPGYGQFMTTLRFESGRVVSITYGDRVK
jgi:Protein of unknown function (DUF2845)